MKYWVIGGGILGFIFAGSGNRFTGLIVGMIAGAAIRRWIFGNFWV